jgi:hypothetical protein
MTRGAVSFGPFEPKARNRAVVKGLQTAMAKRDGTRPCPARLFKFKILCSPAMEPRRNGGSALTSSQALSIAPPCRSPVLRRREGCGSRFASPQIFSRYRNDEAKTPIPYKWFFQKIKIDVRLF